MSLLVKLQEGCFGRGFHKLSRLYLLLLHTKSLAPSQCLMYAIEGAWLDTSLELK
eukprot:c4594_g2_i1 orf=2-163(-)